jgi:hypothetical protein
LQQLHSGPGGARYLGGSLGCLVTGPRFWPIERHPLDTATESNLPTRTRSCRAPITQVQSNRAAAAAAAAATALSLRLPQVPPDGAAPGPAGGRANDGASSPDVRLRPPTLTGCCALRACPVSPSQAPRPPPLPQWLARPPSQPASEMAGLAVRGGESPAHAGPDGTVLGPVAWLVRACWLVGMRLLPVPSLETGDKAAT